MMSVHKPTVATFPGLERIAAMLDGLHPPARPFAEPPADSGLKPVPGDAGPPLIGYSLQTVLDSQALSARKSREYGPVYWSRGLGVSGVFVTGDAATVVLANRDKVFDSGWDTFIERFFNRGLLLLPDSGDHPRHRRIMQWAFTRPRLAGYVARMDELIAARIPEWTGGRPVERVRFYPAMKQLSLDIATVMFMDGQRGESAELEAAFEAAVHAASAIVRFPVPGLSWSKGLRGRATLEEYFRAKIPSKRAAEADTDLFSALCHARSDSGEQFSDDDIVNHMIFLMMAAHDTSTITATGAVYYLAKHPEWQDLVRAECLALGAGDLDIAALESLTSLDLVVKETLRLVSTVPALIRRTIRDTALEGYYLPKGTSVAVMPGVAHSSPEYWTEPDSFDPNRFAEDRREDQAHRSAYVPFGAGPHRCIGLRFGTYEVKLVLHHLLTRYRVEIPADYQLKWDKSALWFPPDGFPITLRALPE